MAIRNFFVTSALAVMFFALPLPAEAGGIPFWGPIINPAWAECPLGWAAVIDVINNIISFALTFAIVFVLPLAIAYGGFRYILNPVSAEGISQAKSIITNVVVGIVLALAAWMIIDLVMATLYNPKNPGQTWSSLITSGGMPACMTVKGVILHPQR